MQFHLLILSTSQTHWSFVSCVETSMQVSQFKNENRTFKLVWRKLRSTRYITQLDMLPTQELFEFEMKLKQTKIYRHGEVATDQQLQEYMVNHIYYKR